MRKVIAVRNNARVGIIRANLLFPAGKVATIMMDVETSRFKEIKACSSLQIVGMEDYVDLDFAAIEAVRKVDVEQSAVVEPEVVEKAEEVVEVVEEVAAEPEPAPEPEPEPEPVIDVTPVVVAAEAPPEDVAELEVLEQVEDDEDEDDLPETVAFDCPYCDDFSAPKKTGALNHVRSKHPDKYDEYKERLRNI